MNKTISLPDELVETVESLGKGNAQSFSGIVRICLERYVENAKKPDGSFEIFNWTIQVIETKDGDIWVYEPIAVY